MLDQLIQLCRRSSSDDSSSSLNPFLNSETVCPSERATEGKRLLNTSSTINKSTSSLRIRPPATECSPKPSEKRSPPRGRRPCYQFYKIGCDSQTGEF